MKAVVTGGAGFIGAQLGGALLRDGHEVIVVDDLSTGVAEHVPPGAEFFKGCITDAELLRTAFAGADVVLHHAARRAVAQSVEDPIETDRINTSGTLRVLVAAKDAGVRRVILASSSSVYGGGDGSPSRETDPPRPQSPYAASKLAGEQYGRVFHQLFGLETVILRYFNVYGPGQRPDAPYAAVVPLFIRALLSDQTPVIEGDGLQSRDFTFIEDVVAANLLALQAPANVVAGQTYNIARGQATSVLELMQELCRITQRPFAPSYAPPRPGDVHRSLADVSNASHAFNFRAHTGVLEGLAATVQACRH